MAIASITEAKKMRSVILKVVWIFTFAYYIGTNGLSIGNALECGPFSRRQTSLENDRWPVL
jgi:hypothetical protein